MSDASTNAEKRLENSLQAIYHRGPDDVGIEWVSAGSNHGSLGLGLTRLAVLDLSPSGHQPMRSSDSRCFLSFNGEITNYVEIREELHKMGRKFRSNTDTEVLLQGFEVWGKGVLDKLEGMYAFAIYDSDKHTLLLARDVYGVKPLFYSFLPDKCLTFSSEIQGIIPLLADHPQVNWQTAIDYLEWGSYDSTEQTFIDGVNQLQPGHYIEFNLADGRLSQPVRYWWPSVKTTSKDSFSEAADTVRTMFLESVSHNLRSDVAVGVALSGGIDSSAITSAIRHVDRDFSLQTFSFISPGFVLSEDKWIDLVVSATGAKAHFVQVDGGDLMRDLDDLIATQGEPFGSTSVYAQYRVFQKAREQGVTVTLDGQGADELFAGYFGYPSKRLHSLIETGHWAAAARYLSAWSASTGHSARQTFFETGAQFLPAAFTRFYFNRKRKSPVINYEIHEGMGLRRGFPGYKVEPAFGNRLKTHLRSELTSLKLPALLRHGDRNSMRFSVESRVPFLSRELTEYIFTLPEKYFVGKDGLSKRILREAMRGIVPQEILNRRDKIGFATPEHDWLRTIDWKTELADYGGSSVLSVDAHSIDLLTAESQSDLRLDNFGKWRFLNLIRWARHFGISLKA